MIDVKQHIVDLKKRNRDTYADFRNETLGTVVEAANQIEQLMRDKGFVPYMSLNTTGVSVGYTLAGKQSLKDMRPFLKAVAKTRIFCPATYTVQAEYGYVTWTFQTKEGDPVKSLSFNIHLGQSVSCKRVATGRMTEEYEVVCDEIPAEMLEI